VNYPVAVTEAGTCKYTIEKCDPLVCSVRLDFEQFIINSWASTDTLDIEFICIDTFEITSVSKVKPYWLMKNFRILKLIFVKNGLF
jgi:hypothetical protein